MNEIIQKTAGATLSTFAKYNDTNAENFTEAFVTVCNLTEDFISKVEKLDALFDEYVDYESLRECFFDLLLLNFFAEDTKRLDEDYLESPEWEVIEEQTIDRGTELLNILLYINECGDENIKPTLTDFLNEFLLVEEEDFQDECAIYEDMIENQVLVESNFEQIATVSLSLNESAIKPLFYAIMSFFVDANPDSDTIKRYIEQAPDKPFDSAVYTLLITYHNQTQQHARTNIQSN